MPTSGNVDGGYLRRFMCVRSKVCAYWKESNDGERVSESCRTCSRIAERKREKTKLLQWNGTLSTGQNLAAQGVIEAATKRIIFLCNGAGKTEMLFYGINEAPSKRRKSLYRKRRERMLFGN